MGLMDVYEEWQEVGDYSDVSETTMGMAAIESADLGDEVWETLIDAGCVD